jgi:hypothetical protein
MNKFIFGLTLFFPFVVCAQKKVTVSGYVEDAFSNERLIGASIFTGQMQGVASNNYGFYSLTLNEGSYNLTASCVGYQSIVQQVKLNSDTIINFLLPADLAIKEVKVTAKDLSGNTSQLSTLSHLNLNMQEIDRAPIIFGERDLLKTLQFQPGIKSGAENTAGFNVRGGSADQNLILLDGVPVYNVNHLFGFFSVFNSDAIKNASLYKGGIPARYGGRLSSVLDISMKEGNMKEPHGVFSISPISARMTYEAPIKKDTAAFIISFRRTILDIPMVLYQSIALESTLGYMFYDFNAKANWIINPSNRIYLSVYSGGDNHFSKNKKDGTKSKYNYNWGNITSVLRWNNQLSPKVFSNFSVYYSNYRLNNLMRSESDKNDTKFQATSDIQDLSIAGDFDWFVSSIYTLRFGGKASRMFFAPNITQVVDGDNETKLNEDQRNKSSNFEAFIENDLKLNRFNLNFGLRSSIYDTGKEIYQHLEPRFAIRYQSINGFSANAAFTGMSQFIHLLSNSSFGMPTDLWVASTDDVKPQTSNQVSVGAEKSLHTYTFGIEVYYKKMKDVIRFDEGAVFLSTQDSKWQENILVGQGQAYGVEFMIKKTKGDLTGMLSYTLAWSERQFNGINQGNWFPHKYDRRHDISFLGEYSILKTKHREKSFSFGFTLQSGNNMSMPDVEYEGMYPLDLFRAEHQDPDWPKSRQTYDTPNNFKMPIFHHLDLGHNTKRITSKGKTHTWSFSVYNVYNRMNPWYYYKDTSGKVKQVSIFPIIPSIGYKYTF